MSKCKDCKHYQDCDEGWRFSEDANFDVACFEPNNKPKTNRDLINAMSDEELAKWKLTFPSDAMDRNGYCRIYWRAPKRCRPELNCNKCLLDWLKAPAGQHQEVG